MGRTMVVFFDKLGIEDVNTVGGKCASLGEMSQIGVPVPPGFAVTTEAFDYFLKQTGALNELENCLGKFPEKPSTVDEFSQMENALQKIIIKKELPTEIRKAVSEGYEYLCDQCKIKNMPVAVRSSGVAEDSPTTSFAGQYESYLNVKGKEEVLEKLVKCWASMFTARGISYRVMHQMPILAGGMSVAVMKMVNSRSSGVAFTLDPFNQDRSKMLIEGNFGVGESVVQGIVTPDKFLIDKKSLQLERKTINKKLRQYSIKDRGTQEENVPDDMQNVCCLKDEEVDKLAEYFKLIDVHYGVPMDIEWAVDNDFPFPENIFLVQARPVTMKSKQKTSSELLLDMFRTFVLDTLKDKKILVVDDEPDILDTVDDLLEMSHVHKASDYETALQDLQTDTYDIVVLDIMGVKGFELLNTSVRRGFPTVMLTAHAMTQEALEKSVAEGASAFVPKEKLAELKDFLELVLLGEREHVWKEVIDQLEPLFNKRFGPSWKETLNFSKKL